MAGPGDSSSVRSATSRGSFNPPKIAKKGGIAHNIRPVNTDLASGTSLPPFSGLGSRSVSSSNNVVVGAARIEQSGEAASAAAGSIGKNSSAGHRETNGYSAADSAETSSSTSSSGGGVSNSRGRQSPQIKASYHVNEDDMILMENVLMCPFTFRSHDAVLCGALAECVMPGMLRASFSERNKLISLELVYDAMGFMQQLERASGNEGSAQIIPGSLELALTPTSTDARVITTAKSPYLIVNVNDVWTQLTGYTQLEVEGREYLTLLDGEGTVPQAYDRPGKARYNLEDIARGRSACATNIHYDKDGNDFIEFVCSYPLAK